MAKKTSNTMQTIVMDGNLQMAEALAAFNASTLAATAALPKALDKCETEQQMQKIIADRDIVQLAYINALHKSLKHTGPLFEQIAKDLACAAKEIEKKSKKLTSAADALSLLADAARLASALALAFV
ncbi:MAG: hypothetical protein OQK66_01190 [Prosthecochloris sp.]|uniref:Uncharacterized protein n=1 Tax=Prosthecochloris aestuarii (strain DSM 271 / SK 413) TaxID=290512 RepID=B4S6T5_PROA2|nr:MULTISPECIES: hypothetical protein [Prosthecochloris]ACF47290.1 hypothetical protein Paes_2289 [Prosthecochloris aestuarii DSM 271]MCW8797562.1 hypothetical protein [Prosthecochloris sp.]NEX12818.1 hypothetical protein [Prosthecochloris sp.]RDD31287.1 hypothetical protein CR161_11595 [Prosthecochloris sp. ZM]